MDNSKLHTVRDDIGEFKYVLNGLKGEGKVTVSLKNDPAASVVVERDTTSPEVELCSDKGERLFVRGATPDSFSHL